jgi:hypothetical protein
MNANTVVAVCATVIAVASLAVSVYEARAARAQNRRSEQCVQPVRRNPYPQVRLHQASSEDA